MKWFRKLRKLPTCLYPSIEVVRQDHFPINRKELQLVVIRRITADNKPDNIIFLMGRQDKIFHKLFNPDFSCTSLGAQYDVHLIALNYPILVGKHQGLKKLCRRFRIRKVVLIQFYLPL